MPTIEYSGMTIDVDEEGYLRKFEDWNEKVACALAEREGIAATCPLTQERMVILKFMRGYFERFNSFPMIREVCRNVHQPAACTYEQFVDPIQAWKIAGLPKPTTEVFAYLQHSPSR